mmetsp:Transcript_11048/g.26199  ORF Transcript_11048/g.26199 Transcript_11048/m.26199 type:complete len:112 (-) Transcript_11048:554-889(-)
MFSMSQTYFSQSVIFVFEHGQNGSAGIILNRPTQYNIQDVSGTERLCPEFGSNLLYLGGDTGRSALNVIHPHGCLKNSLEIVKGVHMGGFEDAKRSVADGILQARPPSKQF